MSGFKLESHFLPHSLLLKEILKIAKRKIFKKDKYNNEKESVWIRTRVFI